MSMSRTGKIVLMVAAALLVAPILLLALAVLVLESEWAEGRIERYASGKLQRQVTLDEIDLRLGWPPRIHLETIQVANPDWARTKHLVDASDVLAAVEVPPLFRGDVVIDRLSIGDGRAGLEQDGERATWRMGEQDDQPSPFTLQHVEVEQGWIYYAAHDEETALDVYVTGSAGGSGELTMKARGTFRGKPATAWAQAPSLLLSADQPLRLAFEAKVGATAASGQGTFQASTQGVGKIDARVSLSGENLADLNELVATHLPETPPYGIEGQLRHGDGTWSLDPLDGRIGDSKVSGTFAYQAASKPPVVRADLTSQYLDFDDLAPLLGAPPSAEAGESASARQKQAADRERKTQSLFPDKPIVTERWKDFAAEVRLVAKEVRSDAGWPIDDLRVNGTLKQGVLRLDPLAFGVAGGKVETKVTLDGSASPPRGEVQGTARGLDLRRIVPELDSDAVSFGSLSGRVSLQGRGPSVDALFASSNGELTLMVEGGRIAALLVEALGLDLAEALAVLAAKDATTPLRCAVADFAVDSGVAKTRAFVIDTRDTLITVEGQVNLDRERLHLVTRPQPKDPSLFSARSPVVISGPLRDPDISVKPGPIAGRVAAAGLLALVNPLLALAPFVELGTAEDANCRQLLKQASTPGPDGKQK